MIVVDATPLQSEHRMRGLGTYTRHLCSELADLDSADRVRFVVEAHDLHVLPDGIARRSSPMWRPHKPAQVYWMYNEVLLRRVVRMQAPLLFHATDFNGLTFCGGITRTLATVHDLTGLDSGPLTMNPSQVLSKLRWRVYYRRKIPRSDHLIAISAQVRDDLVERLGVSEDSITVIPHGVSADIYRPTRSGGAFALHGLYVAYAGSAEPHKNVDRLLEAYARVAREVPELKLLVCGHWLPEQVKRLLRHSSAAGLEGRVKHLGYLSTEDQANLYANAAVFAFPSLREGFGLPILEAMSSGTPVLTSNCGVMSQVAGDAALLVDPMSVESIAQGLLRIFTEPGLARNLVEQGFRRAAQFTWRQTARRTLDLYDRLLHDEMP